MVIVYRWVNNENKIINNWSASEWKVGTGLDIVGGGVLIVTGNIIRSTMIFIYQSRKQPVITSYSSSRGDIFVNFYSEIENTDRLRYEFYDKRDDINL